MTSNNKYSVPYAVPQEPHAVTNKYAQARVADGGWYAWFWSSAVFGAVRFWSSAVRGAVESKAYATRDSGENEQSGSQRTPANGSVTEGRAT